MGGVRASRTMLLDSFRGRPAPGKGEVEGGVQVGVLAIVAALVQAACFAGAPRRRD